MLNDKDIGWLTGEIAATAEALGQVISENTVALMAVDFSSFPKGQLEQALRRVRMESPKLSPKALLDQLDAISGRPGGDEAWALALQARDESLTVIWTDEIQQAWAAASGMAQGKDQVGARMAFKQAYDRIVQDARAQLKSPKTVIAIGHDKVHRLRTVTEAHANRRISLATAIDALEGCAVLEGDCFTPLLAQQQPPAISYTQGGGQPLALPAPTGVAAILDAGSAKSGLLPARVVEAMRAGRERASQAIKQNSRKVGAKARLERMQFARRKQQIDQEVQRRLAAQGDHQ